MKKSVMLIIVALVVLVLLYQENDQFRGWIHDQYEKVQQNFSILPKINDFNEKIIQMESKFKKVKAARDASFQNLEEARAKCSEAQKKHRDDTEKIKWIQDIFEKNGFPDPLNESFDDPKYDYMALKIDGKVMFVRDAVKKLKKRQDECEKQKSKLEESKANIGRLEEELKEIDYQCICYEREIRDLKQAYEENLNITKAEDARKRAENLAKEVKSSNAEFQKLTLENKDRYTAEKEIREKEEANVLYDKPDFKVEVASVPPEVEEAPATKESGETKETPDDSEDTFAYLWQQMQSQFDNSCSK